MVSLECLFLSQACKCHFNLLDHLSSPPGGCMPAHCPVTLSSLAAIREHRTSGVGRGPASFPGAADTEAERSGVIPQCVEATPGPGCRVTPRFSPAALLCPERVHCPQHSWAQVPGSLALSFPNSPALLSFATSLLTHPCPTSGYLPSLGFPGCFLALEQEVIPRFT